jgi:hypothetical protein
MGVNLPHSRAHGKGQCGIWLSTWPGEAAIFAAWDKSIRERQAVADAGYRYLVSFCPLPRF